MVCIFADEVPSFSCNGIIKTKCYYCVFVETMLGETKHVGDELIIMSMVYDTLQPV